MKYLQVASYDSAELSNYKTGFLECYQIPSKTIQQRKSEKSCIGYWVTRCDITINIDYIHFTEQISQPENVSKSGEHPSKINRDNLYIG